MSVMLDKASETADKPTSVAARSRLIKTLSYLVLSLVAVFYLWPLFMLVNTALKTLPQYLKDPAAIVTDPSLANFGEAWELANFPQYMLNSVAVRRHRHRDLRGDVALRGVPDRPGLLQGQQRDPDDVRGGALPAAGADPPVPVDPEPGSLQHPSLGTSCCSSSTRSG
jgi:hypothetical protein